MPPGPLTRTTNAIWSPTHPLIASALDTGAIKLHQWHAFSAQLEPLAHSPSISAPISSLRFSLDGTRLQVVTADNTEHILDATTLQPVSAGASSVWARMRALVSPSRRTARPPTSLWSDPRDTSPDGAWRAVIRDGRLVVEPAKP
jgi:WD40 repeat protein